MRKLNHIAYIILAVLVGLLLAVAVVASFTGDNSLLTGDGSSIASVWFPIAILGVYALVQIGCLALYQFGVNVYKIGFAVLHIGILVMLVGFLAGAIGGEKYYQTFVVGQYRSSLVKDDGSYYDPGFDIGVTNFTVERYDPDENGNQADKYYRADLVLRNSEGGVETAYLEMNKTYRKDGHKFYLMSFDEGKINNQGWSLLNGTLQKSYEGINYDDLCMQIEADYPDQELTWRYFDWRQGVYSDSVNPTDTSDSWWYYAQYADYPGYAHVTEDHGTLYVQIYPKLVVLLIKQDPGEYAVLAGMVLVIVGTVMTCLLRRKKRADAPDGEESPKKKGRSAESEVSRS